MFLPQNVRKRNVCWYVRYQAYKLKMYGPRYVWILLGYIEEKWWTYNDSSVDCTPSQMLEAANGYLATNNLRHAPMNHTTVSGKVSTTQCCYLATELDTSKLEHTPNQRQDFNQSQITMFLKQHNMKKISCLCYSDNCNVPYLNVLIQLLVDPSVESRSTVKQ